MPDALSQWIRVEDRLPSIEQQVWARFAKRNGEPRKVNPVLAGWFLRDPRFGEEFVFGKHRNTCYSLDYCPKAGLTHWQPRIGDIPPSPWIDPTDGARRPVRTMNLSPEERQRRSERMQAYWRKKRGESKLASTGTA
jgi:hypothetical protein